jgi:hypothetical protein
MGIDCTAAPPLIALLKTIGPAVAIAGAILAWLLNKFLGWCVWAIERFLKRYEVMNALLAEIESILRRRRFTTLSLRTVMKRRERLS